MQRKQQGSEDKPVKSHGQVCVLWVTTQDTPQGALTRQLILGSMIFSSFQFSLKLADNGVGEIADVGGVLRRERRLPLAEVTSI